MNTFNSLDEINQHKKKGFEEVFGSVKPKFPNKTINNDLWEQLKYRARPHEVYNLDWSNYNGLDYGNLFLPYIKTMYKGGGVWLYDGAELFKGVKKAKKKVFKFDEQKHLISIINYTYPKGVEIEYKKVTVQPASHEVLTFIEVEQNNTVDIHFKFGKRFKTHLNEAFKREGKSLQISKLESNAYKTNTKSIQSFFKQQVTHYDMMRFILDKLGVEAQLNNLANYNRFFSSNVISYIENFTIAGKYKPYVFIEKSQYDVYFKTEEPKNGNKRIIPEPDEMYIWLVSKDYITYDTSYIKVQFGTTIARDLKQENITKEYIEQLILDQLKSELEQNIYSTKTINKGVIRGLGNAMLRLWILDKLEESELNKEVFKTNPSLFLSLQAADFAIGKLEAVKFKEHNWNPRLSNYTPFLEGNTLDNAFYCGLINGFIDELKAIPEMISLYAKISGSEKEYNAFINGIKKLIDEGIIKTIIEASTKEYVAAIKEGNVEKLYYNFGHDIIQIVSLLIGVFQLAKGISSFVNFTKKALDFIKRFGREGIEKLKKLNKKQIKEVFDELESDNIKKGDLNYGRYGGKILNDKEIEGWRRLLKNKFKAKLEKVDSFSDPDVLAQFDPNTNTIKYKEGVTEYIMSHEHFHAEEMHEIGFKKYVKDASLKGTKFPDEYTDVSLTRSYKREKYVHDQIIKKGGFNNQEMQHNFFNLDFYAYHLEKRNIAIPN